MNSDTIAGLEENTCELGASEWVTPTSIEEELGSNRGGFERTSTGMGVAKLGSP